MRATPIGRGGGKRAAEGKGSGGPRSATGASAYRAGIEIRDERTGLVFNYKPRQSTVLHSRIYLPEGAGAWALDPRSLWNAAELAEKRKDATLAREFEIQIPHELSAEQMRVVVNRICEDIARRRRCAVHGCIHRPSRKGDQRNFHVHVLMSTRVPGSAGFEEKIASERIAASHERAAAMTVERELAASYLNQALSEAGVALHIEHRSFEERGIALEPTVHLGPAATGMERRGERTEMGDRNRAIRRRNRARIEAAREDESLQRMVAEQDKLKADLATTVDLLPAQGSISTNGKFVYKGRLFNPRHGVSTGLSKSIVYVDSSRPGQRRAFLNSRAWVTDFGDRLTTTLIKDDAIALLIETAVSKGWTEVELTGSGEFQARMRAEFNRLGIEVLQSATPIEEPTPAPTTPQPTAQQLAEQRAVENTAAKNVALLAARQELAAAQAAERLLDGTADPIARAAVVDRTIAALAAVRQLAPAHKSHSPTPRAGRAPTSNQENKDEPTTRPS